MRLSLATVVLLAFVAMPALALPKTLTGALQQAYATQNLRIDSLCHESIGGRSYSLVDLTLLKSKKPRQAVLAYRRSGWRTVWKDGTITRAVPKSQWSRARAAVKELRRFCGDK